VGGVAGGVRGGDVGGQRGTLPQHGTGDEGPQGAISGDPGLPPSTENPPGSSPRTAGGGTGGTGSGSKTQTGSGQEPGSGSGSGAQHPNVDFVTQLASLIIDPESLYNATKVKSGSGTPVGSSWGIIKGWLAKALTWVVAFGSWAKSLITKAFGELKAGLRKLEERLLERWERKALKQGLTGIPGAKRLSQSEQATAARLLQDRPDLQLVESEHLGAEYVDQSGRTYDALGNPAASKYWNEDQFLRSIDSHLLKSNDFTVIDLTGFTKDQINAVSHYINNLPSASRDKIIRIGF
jgi:hypothetical protein